jgi:hypothetical protein
VGHLEWLPGGDLESGQTGEAFAEGVVFHLFVGYFGMEKLRRASHMFFSKMSHLMGSEI